VATVVGQAFAAEPHATPRAWAWRLLPPLLLLWAFSTRNGIELYAYGVLMVPVVLWCFVTFSANLIRWQPLRMVRPGLCLAIVAAWWIYLSWSISGAAHFADALAERMQARCNSAGHCPLAIAGWSKAGDASRRMYGHPVQWQVHYTSDGSEFQVYVSLGLDADRGARGGVGKPLVRSGDR
jgi:hypothetical protein